MENFKYDNENTVVTTEKGKLRGFFSRGVYYFYGIKYANAKRFQMPEPVEHWEGIKEAVSYGYVCPTNGTPVPSGEVYIPHRFWPADENCQYLNVWTKSLQPEQKKPVFVWLHGGGFADGSSIEQVAYEGDELAKNEDIVVVSLNHRLNILGFLDMSSFGEKYWNSGNVGMADIVMALQWIQQNIEAFGGDPGNVTICGQSGGGGKVQTLLQIPDAEGLFHKGIIMSGIHEGGRDNKEDHREIVLRMLKELDITEEDVEELENVPYQKLIMAFNRVQKELLEQDQIIRWTPIKNTWYLGDPCENEMAEFSLHIPMIAGSTFAEFASRDYVAQEEQLSETEQFQLLRETFGEDTDQILRIFKNTFPDKEGIALLVEDSLCRIPTIEYARKRSKQAPAYLYLFAPKFQMKGTTEAWHCADIPFLFHNVDRVPYTDETSAGHQLEKEFMSTFMGFVKTGTPGEANGQKWESVRPDSCTTMLFGENTRAVENLDGEIMQIIRKHVVNPDMKEFTKQMILDREKDGVDWNY